MRKSTKVRLVSIVSCVALNAESIDKSNFGKGGHSLLVTTTYHAGVPVSSTASPFNPIVGRQVARPAPYQPAHGFIGTPRPPSRDSFRKAEDQEREAQSVQENRQREFETKFNQLVEAVATFATRYNEGKGTVWPKREADRIRKAIRQLQSAGSWRD